MAVKDILSMVPDSGSYASRLRALRNAREATYNDGTVNEADRVKLRNTFDAMRDDTLLGIGLTGLTGAITLGNQIYDNSQGADLSFYDNQIADMSAQRGQNYYNNNAVLNGYNTLPTGFNLSVGDVNPTTWDSAKQIGSTALTGVTTGAQIGGPIGALVGGAVGLAGGLFADHNQRTTNAVNVNLANARQNYQQSANQYAMRSGVDQAKENQFGHQYGKRLANGGFLREWGSPAGYSITRKHCKGGTLVRIKAK